MGYYTEVFGVIIDEILLQSLIDLVSSAIYKIKDKQESIYFKISTISSLFST